MSIANLKVLTTKTLIGAAIILGSGVGLAAPASASTGPSSTDPNPAVKAEIDRGLSAGSRRLVARTARTGPPQPTSVVTYFCRRAMADAEMVRGGLRDLGASAR